MPARRALPDEHHVMRYMSASKRFVDENGQRLGPSAAGFKLRADDKGGLSVTEIEHFGAFDLASIRDGAVAFRESQEKKQLGKNAIFAWAKIADAKSAAYSYSKKIRVVHDPVAGNPGHAEIRQFDDDDLDLLDYFSSGVFTKYQTVGDLDLP